VRHDDGANLLPCTAPHRAHGRVATSKRAPMYLAQRGYKTGNVPLVRVSNRRGNSSDLIRRKCFGLVGDVENLTAMRRRARFDAQRCFQPVRQRRGDFAAKRRRVDAAVPHARLARVIDVSVAPSKRTRRASSSWSGVSGRCWGDGAE